ncbi:protein shisa-6-like [Corythoichthys intestinalis]|uniref:protein shisa-6-like n=1 Tax=Corythoichthys intestinalis TaxID=161448 RepID=UPI0025A5C019|nr:protein shisa-6-like [Corythoichthys intestinalis]
MTTKATNSPGIFCCSLLLFSCLAVSTVTTDNDVKKPPPAGKAAQRDTLFLLTGYKAPPKGALKKAEVEDAAETPPKPLPQTMLPRNVTDDALKPPLGAAQVAPAPRQLVDVDVCRGYFDVMGHFDSTFNCSKGSYIYCCGTCHYRFCCEHQRNRLDQESCTNYKSPEWADPQVPVTVPAEDKPDPDFETLQQQNSSTAYVIGGVLSFTLVVAVGVRIAFSKVARRPRNRDANMPRSLVDILRHQSSPVQHGERNNMLTTSDGRTAKNMYTPILQSKDNRKRGARMNNLGTPQLSSGPKLIASSSSGKGLSLGGGMRHSSSQASFSHSFHNLAQLPPSYEAAVKPEISRYSSLKKLERELDEYSGFYSSKRRSTNAPPTFYSSQHHLHWADDYAGGSSRGTLPLEGSRPRAYVPPSTPNPYPLPVPSGYSFERPPRRVRSQDQLLAFGEGNTLARLLGNQQQQQHYRNLMGAGPRSAASQTLRRSHERLLVSPDRLEDQLLAMGLMSERGGMVPTMGRLSHHHKTQSQQNICTPPSADRHHMIKMNSHPTSGHEHGNWDVHPGARRAAFAGKRQNTLEQLHFIPTAGHAHAMRTASKNEVTV